MPGNINIVKIDKVKIEGQAYFKTQEGFIKVVQFVLGIVLIFGHPPVYLAVIVYIAAFLTFVWIWIYAFSLHVKHPKVPWEWIDVIYSGGTTITYSVMTVITLFLRPFSMSMIFGLVNTLAYAYGTFLGVMVLKNKYGDSDAEQALRT